MRTEIAKSYEWGFLVNEQELRRIFQSCHEHAQKVATGPFNTRIKVALKDGAILEPHAIDDVLSLENGGARAIRRIEIGMSPDVVPPPWSLEVSFEVAKSATKWQSISYRVVGDSRDWAFVAAADLEDRVRKVKVLAWESILDKKMVAMSVLALSFLILTAAVALYDPSANTHQLLSEQYAAGKLKDPIQAIIELERIRSESRISTLAIPFFGIFLPILLLSGLPLLLSVFGSSYTFYWGDAQSAYDKRRNRKMILWTAVILGLLAACRTEFVS